MVVMATGEIGPDITTKMRVHENKARIAAGMQATQYDPPGGRVTTYI